MIGLEKANDSLAVTVSSAYNLHYTDYTRSSSDHAVQQTQLKIDETNIEHAWEIY
jgi:hypothetical protein